jgi:hypothetical protein
MAVTLVVLIKGEKNHQQQPTTEKCYASLLPYNTFSLISFSGVRQKRSETTDTGKSSGKVAVFGQRKFGSNENPLFCWWVCL